MTGDAKSQAVIPNRRNTILLAGALVLVLVAAGFAVRFGYAWWNAGDDASTNYAQQRDVVKRVGVGAIKNFTTLDYTKPDEYFRNISSSTTGELHDELTRSRGKYRKGLVAARSRTEGAVLDSAVTSLDLNKGTAKMIAAVDATVTGGKRQPTTQRLWLQIELDRTGSIWKVSRLLGAPGASTAGQ
jgi:Mce-associated membrane protein